MIEFSSPKFVALVRAENIDLQAREPLDHADEFGDTLRVWLLVFM
jgi:hypothetical protein